MNTDKKEFLRRPKESIFSRKDDEELASSDSAPAAPKREAKEEAPRVSRAPMRDSVRRAKERAAVVREHIGSMDEGVDEFYIDRDIIPEGWGYEWKMQFVMGREEPAYAVALSRKGWEPVPADRHPELMPKGSKEAYITRKGMILMERPQELIDEAREIEARRAKLQVRNKEEQLSAAPAGQFERSNKDTPLTRVKKSFEPVPIPE